MNTEKLTVLALADMMLATDGSVGSLVAACHRVFDMTPPWAPAVCAELLTRADGNFHYFSRHELTALLWQCLGRGDGNEDDNDGDGDGDGDG
ncbi:MAG: hypothetical protein K2X55_11850, partial [Burkholderiaceae bacterium]|nr:hypothetical protein [Burkholderiaceae bacterium]